MIPKTIHYCWFGKGKKGRVFKKCLKSWKKYYPDYKIIEWNENNFDVKGIEFTKEAYKEKKYAFVSDYARLKIIYENGGIYFDTDVEARKRIDKRILEKGYLAEETKGIIATGLGFSAPKGNPAIRIMMEDYEDDSFYRTGKNKNMIPCPIKNTNKLKEAGYIIKEFQEIEGLTVFPPEFFCGYDINNSCIYVTKETYTIHHYKGSWLSPKEKAKETIKRVISKILGKKNFERIRHIKNKQKNSFKEKDKNNN